jgi:insertion element IS1 protein InsB
MRVCPQCRSARLVNNGSAAGKPKKRCPLCGYQFTRTTPRGKPLKTKSNAVLFYLSGMSMNRIAFLLQVSAQAVLNGLRAFAKKHYETPKPTGNIIILELDEMWHYLKNKRRKLWSWKALARDTGSLLDGECGRRDKAPLKKLSDCLVPWAVQVYGTAQWATSASVIPQAKLVQSKATTQDIERNHCRQRHGFGRFKRQSMIVSQSTAMVELTMALFAKFWVNGHQDELLSLLG